MTLTKKQIDGVEYFTSLVRKNDPWGRKAADDEILIQYRGLLATDLAALRSQLRPITPKIRSLDSSKMGEVGLHGPTTIVEPWIIVPITLAIIVGKGLLDGFLKEFGADGAKALKGTLKRIFQEQKTKKHKYTTIFPDGLPPKTKYPPATLLSIKLHLGIGSISAKFDFPVNLTKAEVSAALGAIPDEVRFAKKLAGTKIPKSGVLQFRFVNDEWNLVEKRTGKKGKTHIPHKGERKERWRY